MTRIAIDENTQLEPEQLYSQELIKENPDFAKLFAIEENRQAFLDFIRRRQEGIEISDYIFGLFFILSGLVVLLVGIRSYWSMHGGNIETFAFWAKGDKRWLEVIFWSFFTAIVRSINTAAWDIRGQKLQKRDILLGAGLIFEGPIVALSLTLVITNLGLSFGDTNISLTEIPMTIIIGLSVVFTYFAQDSVETLKHVSAWFREQVESKLQFRGNDIGSEGDLRLDPALGKNTEVTQIE